MKNICPFMVTSSSTSRCALTSCTLYHEEERDCAINVIANVLKNADQKPITTGKDDDK